jgi:hypothetical protein
MLAEHSTQLPRSLEDLFSIKYFTQPSVVSDGSGVEAHGKESADEERRQLHYGCKLLRLILLTTGYS